MNRKGGCGSSAKSAFSKPAAGESAAEAVATVGRQRIDRWLWHARLVRTRSAAASLAAAGYVRVNGARIDAPGRMVRRGDVVTVALDHAVRVLKVRGFVERRGSASGGQDLYEELREGV
jgi:ribosomal 50S subunit-recycling heat shock protein